MAKSSLLAAISLGASIAACASPQDMTGVEATVDQFYERQQAGKDELIYQETPEPYRSASPLEEWVRLNQAIRNLLPTCGAPVRDPAAVRTTQSTSGLFIEVQYGRSCKGALLTENFALKRKGAAYVLVGYNVSATALLAPPIPDTAVQPPTLK